VKLVAVPKLNAVVFGKYTKLTATAAEAVQGGNSGEHKEYAPA
jgi:hypothetical protein